MIFSHNEDNTDEDLPEYNEPKTEQRRQRVTTYSTKRNLGFHDTVSVAKASSHVSQDEEQDKLSSTLLQTNTMKNSRPDNATIPVNDLHHKSGSSYSVPAFVFDFFKGKKVSFKQAPFAIIEHNILQTLANAYQCDEISFNKDLSEYIMNWIDRLSLIKSCSPKYLRGYMKEIRNFEEKLARRVSHLLKHSDSKIKSHNLPIPPRLIVEIDKINDCLYPNWPEILNNVKQIVNSDQSHVIITYMIVQYYKHSKTIRIMKKLFNCIQELQNQIQRQYKISCL